MSVFLIYASYLLARDLHWGTVPRHSRPVVWIIAYASHFIRPCRQRRDRFDLSKTRASAGLCLNGPWTICHLFNYLLRASPPRIRASYVVAAGRFPSRYFGRQKKSIYFFFLNETLTDLYIIIRVYVCDVSRYRIWCVVIHVKNRMGRMGRVSGEEDSRVYTFLFIFFTSHLRYQEGQDKSNVVVYIICCYNTENHHIIRTCNLTAAVRVGGTRTSFDAYTVIIYTVARDTRRYRARGWLMRNPYPAAAAAVDT